MHLPPLEEFLSWLLMDGCPAFRALPSLITFFKLQHCRHWRRMTVQCEKNLTERRQERTITLTHMQVISSSVLYMWNKNKAELLYDKAFQKILYHVHVTSMPHFQDVPFSSKLIFSLWCTKLKPRNGKTITQPIRFTRLESNWFGWTTVWLFIFLHKNKLMLRFFLNNILSSGMTWGLSSIQSSSCILKFRGKISFIEWSSGMTRSTSRCRWSCAFASLTLCISPFGKIII